MGTTMTNSTLEKENEVVLQYMEKVLSSVPLPSARKCVADYLRNMADVVENEQINGFKIEWQNGWDYIDSVIAPVYPVSFIKLNLTVEE